MFKRMSLVFMLLTALVGITGVQAQTAAEPQSMAQYVPADSDMFFAIRTDGAFLDELSTLVNGVVEKLPQEVQAQAQMLDLKSLIESQVGPISDTGIGDYVAMSASNIGVAYDQDFDNNNDVVYYVVVDLADREKFEAFFEKSAGSSTSFEKETEDGVTVYTPSDQDEGEGVVFVQDDVAYITNQDAVPSGDTLGDNGDFSDTLSQLPESSYNFVVYADYGKIFSAMMENVPASQMEIFETMGMDLSNYGAIAFAGTVLDEKSLVIDAVTPSPSAIMEGLDFSGTIDPAFAENIPAEMSFVAHGTNLQKILDVYLDLIVKAMEAQPNQNQQLSREQLNGLLQVYLGVDFDNDILPWLGGDYAVMADFDAAGLLDMAASGNMSDMDELPISPRFAFVTETDGSEKPGEFVAALGKVLTTQTANMDDAPEFEIESNDSGTTIIIEDIADDAGFELNIQITGNGEFFVIGDQATVEAILSGEGGFTESAGFVEAQQYILPNPSTIAYAGGEGWADLVSLGFLGFASSMGPVGGESDNNQMDPIIEALTSVYDIIGSSSISATFTESGSQISRIVLTLK